MLLYDIKEKTLDIYELNSDETIKDYRIDKILEIPEEERMYIGQVFLSSLLLPVLELNHDQFDTNIISIEELNNEFSHKFIADDPNERNNILTIANYCSGGLNECDVARVQDLDRLKYFLLSSKKYEKDECYNGKIMRGIIQIPESLYLLQLLEQQKFTLIGDRDISEQLSLYNVSRIDEVSIENIKKSDAYGLTESAYQRTLTKAEEDKKILKYIKK